MDLLFYDGNCGMCHGLVRFLMHRDPEGRLFRFAPLGGETFSTTVPAELAATLPDTAVLSTADGKLLIRSDATLTALAQLGGIWGPLARCASWLPRPLRDVTYDGVARVRHRLFPAPPTRCPVVPANLQSRFQP